LAHLAAYLVRTGKGRAKIQHTQAIFDGEVDNLFIHAGAQTRQ